MLVFSVNIGAVQPMENAKSLGKTGIYKQSTNGDVQVTANGLAGDAICDIENHGGVDQAVYVYGTSDYAWWSAELGRDLGPGTFGENITITDLESDQFSVGDRLQIGDVTLEVTAPRIPCVTLARRMDDPAFLKRFRAAERPGLYCRVLHEGAIHAGQPVTVERYAGETLTAIEMFRDAFVPHHDLATLRRHLAAPIAIRDRVAKERELQELLAQEAGA